MAPIIIILILDILVMVAMLYVGTREEHKPEMAAADSAAVASLNAVLAQTEMTPESAESSPE